MIKLYKDYRESADDYNNKTFYQKVVFVFDYQLIDSNYNEYKTKQHFLEFKDGHIE